TQLNFIVRAFAVIVLWVVVLGTLLQATASVGREREQKTLDVLLTLPNGRDGLLEMKWLGSLLFGRWLLLGMLPVLAIGVMGGGVHMLALPLFAIVVGIHLVFVASLGVYISVLIPGVGRAGLVGVVVLFAVCVAPLAYCPGYYGFVLPAAWV